MIVGAWQAGLSIFKIADILGFLCTTGSGVPWEKAPLSNSSADGNILIKRKVKVE